MKTLLRIATLFVLLLASAIGYGQTPVSDQRIADTNTAFIVNIPVGTKFTVGFPTATSVWVCRRPAAIGTKISSMAGSGTAFYNFVQLATGSAHDAVTIKNPANGLTISGQVLHLSDAAADSSGALTSVDWTNFNKAYDSVSNGKYIPKYMIDAAGDIIVGTGNNTVTRLAIGTARKFLRVNSAGNALEWDTIQWAATAASGLLKSTDWNTFNNKLSAEVDGSITNEGALTVVDGSSAADIHSNTSGSTNVTISAGTGISVEGAGSTITIGSTVAAYSHYVNDFELAGDSTNRCILTLTNTPITNTIQVQVNGMNLKPTTQWTLVETKKIRMPFTVYQYDRVSITYNY